MAGLLVVFVAGLAAAPRPASAPGIAAVYRIDAPADFAFTGEADLARLRALPQQRYDSFDDIPQALNREHWSRLELTRDAAEAEPELWLRMNAAHQWDITAYLVVDGQIVRMARSGFAVQPEAKTMQDVDLLLSLEAWHAGVGEVFVRNRPAQTLTAAAEVIAEPELWQRSNAKSLLNAAYFGGACFIMLFQVVIFASFRDAASRDYVIFALGILAAAAGRAGYFDFYLSPLLGGFYLGTWMPHLRIINTALAFRTLSSFFELRAKAPWAERWCRLSVLGLAAVLLLSPGLEATRFERWAAGLQLYGVASAVAICILALRLRLVAAAVTGVAWAGLLIAAAWLNLATLGVVPKSSFLPFVPVVGVLWEMFFSTLGLTYKFRRYQELAHERELKGLEVSALQRLVRVLCHDVSTPLNVIDYSVDRMEGDLREGRKAEAGTALRRIRGALTAVAETVESVRQLEALRTSGQPLKLVPTALDAVVQEAVELARPVAGAKGIELQFTPAAKPARAWAEPRMLRISVLGNALANAIKFSQPRSRIEITVKPVADAVVVCVRDHGIGMPEKLRLALSGPDRVESRLGTLGEGGTGLGLQLMRDFALAMQGELRITSATAAEAPGASGTAVEIRLRPAPASGMADDPDRL